jgi:predicted transcriptional regulator
MSSSDSQLSKTDDLLKFASDIVAAYVANNPIPISEIPGMIKSIHATLGGLANGTAVDGASAQKPAIPVKKSITPEYIICLEDGKKLKMLKRYLRSRYNLTPEEYRAKWGLANGQSLPRRSVWDEQRPPQRAGGAASSSHGTGNTARRDLCLAASPFQNVLQLAKCRLFQRGAR